MGLQQYLKETQGELRLVSWPTQTQTIVYTILVALISVFTAVYLGLFDFLFTSTLARVVENTAPAAQTQTASSTATSTVSTSSPQVATTTSTTTKK